MPLLNPEFFIIQVREGATSAESTNPMRGPSLHLLTLVAYKSGGSLFQSIHHRIFFFSKTHFEDRKGTRSRSHFVLRSLGEGGLSLFFWYPKRTNVATR
jgi:hypothetical protein